MNLHFIAFFLGIFVKNAISGISCFHGNHLSRWTLLDITKDQVSSKTTLKQNCDYCSIRRSTFTFPRTYEGIRWRCGQFTVGSKGDECVTEVRRTKRSGMSSYHCLCCSNNCNNGLRCLNDGFFDEYGVVESSGERDTTHRKVTCYNGTAESTGKKLKVTWDNILAMAMPIENCDYCSFSRSTTPFGDSMTWICEKLETSSGHCATKVQLKNGSQTNQYSCRCCEHGCNIGPHCKNDGMTETSAVFKKPVQNDEINVRSSTRTFKSVDATVAIPATVASVAVGEITSKTPTTAKTSINNKVVFDLDPFGRKSQSENSAAPIHVKLTLVFVYFMLSLML